MAAVASLVPSARASTDLYLIRGRDGHRPKRGRVKSVTWAAEDTICQVRQFLSEDCPYMLGPVQKGTCHLHDSGFSKHKGIVDCPPGFGRSALKRARVECELNMSVEIQWCCPMKCVLEAELYVAAGDESTEVTQQRNRELTVFEAFYPRVSSIPDSPLEPQECCSNDLVGYQVPLIPLDDEEVGGVIAGSQGCGSAQGESNTGAHPSSSEGYVDLEPKPAMTGDGNVAAAAACMVVEKLGVKDQVDQQLLLDILRNPALINALTSTNQVMKESISFKCGNVLDKSCHGTVDSRHLDQLAGDQHSTLSSALFVDHSRPYDSSSACSVAYSNGYAGGVGTCHSSFLPQSMLNNTPGSGMEEAKAYDSEIASGHGDFQYSFHVNSANVSPVIPNGCYSSHYYKPIMNDTTMSLARASQDINRYAYGGSSVRSVGKSKRLCMFFNTPKGCRNGENCAFLHQTSIQS